MRAEMLEAAIVHDIAAWARNPGPIIEQLRERLASSWLRPATPQRNWWASEHGLLPRSASRTP
jgi:hypothetical protein